MNWGRAPGGGVTMNGIEDEAGKFGPDGLLPEVGIDGDGDGEGDGGAAEAGGDDNLEGSGRKENEVEELRDKQNSQLGAEDDASKDEEEDGHDVPSNYSFAFRGRADRYGKDFPQRQRA